MKRILLAATLAALPLTAAASRDRVAAPISSADVLAAERALAGPEMRGRGSGTADEARAADWVAVQFKAAGLKPAPGMDGYLEIAPIVRRTAAGTPTLTVDGVALPGVGVVTTDGGIVEGKTAIIDGTESGIPDAAVLVYTGAPDRLSQVRRAARGKARLILTAESDAMRRYLAASGGKPQLRTTLEGGGAWSGVALATLPADALARIKPGSSVSLDVPFASEKGVTTNAIAYLPGTDPKAGVILLSAHLDHLGVRPDGTVMPGANDDASGTVAVIELARAFAKMKPAKRSILFVAYGSEELGGLGSTWFGQHPPIALDRIVANIELEMIGAQDAKLPKGALMVTGAERSTLFAMLKANGALVAPDPYPEQHFFERSDNYSLALKGIVAHTLSGWVGPTYHQPTDTVENLDIAYMTAAINSLVAPIRTLADGDFTPQWTANGQPVGSR
ncbi:MAG: M28 family peptidase [Sphingomonas sp.]|uniref:M28 family metallopeptidase n=1 Tax=Sphingomonas sp. TaxID=28214 RepID=UPI00122498F1|nr:M28 family peptidase [Sphingomonas sp.]THD35258.1 MAG: M28 family peptidase [Sphingomonas sp.]